MAASAEYNQFLQAIADGSLSKAKSLLSGLSGGERTKAARAVARLEKTIASGKNLAREEEKKKSDKSGPKKAVSFVEYIDQLNVKLSTSNAAFANNTKAQSDALNQIAKYSLSVRDLGFNLQQTTERFNHLSKTLATRVRKGFEKTQGQLLSQTLIWERLGVSIGTSTALINDFDTTMGMSTREITTFGRTMTNFAVNTGQDVNKVFKDMSANMHLFHDNLDNAAAQKNAFMFQRRARAMGMEMGKLHGIMGKFENLDTAQQTGAQLNAVLTSLGGSFDAVKASAMDYPERMNYIVQSIQKVAPRLKSAAPRVQRAYMNAFSQAGFGPTQVRKLINFDANQLAGGGVPGPMGAAQERTLAQRMTGLGQARAATFGVSRNEAVAVGMGAAGIPQGQLVAVGKQVAQTVGQGFVNVVSKAVGDSSEAIATALTKQLEGSEFEKKLGEFTTIMTKFITNVNVENTKVTRRVSCMERGGAKC
jgi:hypothetical protein